MIYKGKNLSEISFPLGGIGTGSIGLAGNGSLIDWEIFNRPNKGGDNGYSFFAVRAEYPDGRSVTKILQGDVTNNLTGTYQKRRFRGFGYGPTSETMAGYPHFERVTFDGRFPIARLSFEDKGFPARVEMTAYNPFIPLNSEDSSIPVASFDIKIRSREVGVTYSVYLSMTNPYTKTKNERIESRRYTAIKLMRCGVERGSTDYGDMTLALAEPEALACEYWYRGRWQDKASTFWHELTHGELHERRYDTEGDHDTATVGSSHEISRGCSHTWSFVISWSFPYSTQGDNTRKDAEGKRQIFKNYYATRFESSRESALYALKNRKRLFSETETFAKSLHGSTLDPAVIDAAASTLSVLKSPTVVRTEDGTFWGWEGVHELEGSCEGTCTHVWNYAYAMPFLFPDLERSIRETEFNFDTTEDGDMRFRTPLPFDKYTGGGIPCVDGQMGSVIKAYREWKISGDDEWLRRNYRKIRLLLDFATSDKNKYEWDRDCDGVLEGRQHHTLDMELFGPSSWLEGFYLAALLALAEMAEFMGDNEAAAEYRRRYKYGFEWTRENLFNGEYFIQRVDLKDRSRTEHFGCPEYWNEEKGELKYQIAEGCEIDQCLAQWHATLLGLGDIFDKEQLKTALKNTFSHLFKPSMREVANIWRVFALNDESGTVMCDYPEGVYHPVIPITYTEECMTGFEYAFAGLLISEGLIDEGLTAVRAVRARYNGENRNPYNEIECGSNYARAMASFALLPIFSGFSFDLSHGRIGFSPITNGDYRCFFSVGTAWGEYERTGSTESIRILGGELKLNTVTLRTSEGLRSVAVDGVGVPFVANGGEIDLGGITAKNSIVFTFR